MPKVKYPIFKCLHRGEKGFTLIELLIVIAILGIIAAVVIPNISGFLISGQLAAANTEAENVKTAELGYFADYSMWPVTSDNLTATGYISGVLKALYTFDSGPTGCGWIVSANATPTGWSGIVFSPGLAGSTGYHGKWIKAP
jgi:type IV pilus assembly protein PilA